MKLLVLGGTVFLGRHIVAEALERGHEVTLFNRGSNTALFAGQVEQVTGDRNEGFTALDARQFDACIDTSGYLPDQMDLAGRHFADRVDQYAFVSTISVYPKYFENLDETAPVAELPDDADASDYKDEFYGPLKVLCERRIEHWLPGRVLQVRSGLIVGPYDPTNRFTYWPARVAEGGDILAPCSAELPVQMIHARDQAVWILDMLQRKQAGIFNVTSDNGTYTLGDVINATIKITGVNAAVHYASSDFLQKNDIAPWMGLPLWLPEAAQNMSRVSAAKAAATGLNLRPLTDIINDTLNWYQQQPARDWPAGISREKEREVLAALETVKV